MTEIQYIMWHVNPANQWFEDFEASMHREYRFDTSMGVGDFYGGMRWELDFMTPNNRHMILRDIGRTIQKYSLLTKVESGDGPSADGKYYCWNYNGDRECYAKHLKTDHQMGEGRCMVRGCKCKEYMPYGGTLHIFMPHGAGTPSLGSGLERMLHLNRQC